MSVSHSAGGAFSSLSEQRLVRLVVLAGLVAGLGYLATELYVLSDIRGFPLDDSWIHLQFARNLAAGEGLTYNPGELVIGTTAPLWTALSSFLHLLPGSPVIWSKLAGLGLYLLGMHATFRLARALSLSKQLAALAALLTMSTGWLVWSALSGLEIPLFILLSLWGIILHIRERSRPSSTPPYSWFLLGLSILARPEGMLLAALAVIDRLLVWGQGEDGRLRWQPPKWGSLWAGIGVVVLLVGPLALFNLAVGGSVLPSTFAAKTAGFQQWLPNLQYLYSVLAIFFRPQPFMVLFAGAGAIALVERLGTSKDRGLLPALWLFGLPLAYSLMGSASGEVVAGNFGRYFFPLYPVLAVVGVLGLEGLVQFLATQIPQGWPLRVLAAVLVLVLLWPTFSSLILGAGRYVQTVANVRDSDVEVAYWLGERLPPAALLAVNDVGAIKYLLPNSVLDLAGIITPKARRYMKDAAEREGDWRQGVQRLLEEERPDYLVVFPAWFPWLVSEGSPYQLVHGVRIPGNIAMGGDELVVLSTPWTRYPLVEK
ncbi:MAG: hypothetical protein WBC09_13030 [Thermoanaerobaculia bacterium]